MSNREHTSFSKIIGDVAPTQYTRLFAHMPKGYV